MAVNREPRLYGPQQILIPLDTQVRMQSTLHQNPGASKINRFLDLVEDLFLRQDVSFLVAHRAIERAEAAILGAEVRVVDIPVDDVGNDAFRMKLLSHRIRRHPDPDKVVGRKKIDQFLPVHVSASIMLVWNAASHPYSRRQDPGPDQGTWTGDRS